MSQEKGLVVIGEDQQMDLILSATRGGQMTAESYEAMEILSQGAIPDWALEKRPGPSGQEIVYIDHIYTTELLNRAFRWLWEWEGGIQVIPGPDGSIATVNRLTIHWPMMEQDENGEIRIVRDSEGRTVLNKRVIQEIGSSEGYPKTVSVRDGVNEDGSVRYRNEIERDINGNIVYTMPFSDRVASSVSRGLVKCVQRAFNLGLHLMDKERKAKKNVMTPRKALDLAVRYAERKGITDLVGQDGVTRTVQDQVLQICKDLGKSGSFRAEWFQDITSEIDRRQTTVPEV